MIEYTYKVNNLMVKETPEPMTVAMVNFTISGTDGTHTGQVTYSINLPPPDVSSFVPYNELTEVQVVEWIKDTLGTGNIATQASMEAEVDAQIAA